MKKQKFELGQTVITSGAGQLDHSEISVALARHSTGDWGDICEDDAEMNEQSLIHGERLISSYKTSDGTKFWIITERDRSATTILLPSEY